MKSKQEIKEWLLENAVNRNGNLDLSDLDFSDFEGIIDISRMKVTGDLWQNEQVVHGDLVQGLQKVKGNLYQNFQQVERHLFQQYQTVGKDLEQYKQTVSGSLCTHKPEDDEIMEDIEYGYFTIKKSIDKTK